MSLSHLNLNRPVHLARRDLYFERVVELLCAPIPDMETPERLKRVESVLALLRTAESHATVSARSTNASEREHDFVHFLRLISQNVQSVQAMMQNQIHLGEEESFLCQFLDTNHEECALPAMAYGRRADDILQGLWHVLQQALTPYRTLQKENVDSMTEDERSRYNQASESIREELASRTPTVP